MCSVGLDIGGTYLKAARLERKPLSVHRRPIPDFLDTTGSARELDPSTLLAAVTDLLGDVIGDEDCDRIFVTGQMAGLAFIDGSGQAIAPLISWQDTRFSDVASVRKQLAESDVAKLGDGLRIGLPLVTLAQREGEEGAFVTSLTSFVTGALAGERAAFIHATDAASLGMLDVATCEWLSGALRVAHLDTDRLPTPRSDVISVGRSPQYGAQVMTAVGDQQAALLGAGLADGQISMNIATGCQVSRLSARAESPAQLRPYFGGRYLQTITHLPAGRLLAAAVEQEAGRRPTAEDWETSLAALNGSTPVGQALMEIADACVEAANRLGSAPSVLFSGGLAQKLPSLRERILAELGVSGEVFAGDDAALQGLAVLAAAN